MISNDVKDGMEIRLTHSRQGWMRDNKSGIIRTVEVEVPGQGTDVGSCYINELLSVKVDTIWEPIAITPAHKTQLNKIGW